MDKSQATIQSKKSPELVLKEGFDPKRPGKFRIGRNDWDQASAKVQSIPRSLSMVYMYRALPRRSPGTTVQQPRGKGAQPTAAQSRHCSLPAALSSCRHNPTLTAWKHQRIAWGAWRVGATSGIGASDPALQRTLR